MQDLADHGLTKVEVLDRHGATILGRATDGLLAREATLLVTGLRGIPGPTARRHRSVLSTFSRLGHHPAMARIWRVAELREAIAVVLQPVDGTLRDRLRADGCLPVREALDVAVQLCGALASLHRSGVVHGDLRPPTVALDVRGHVVLLPPPPLPAAGEPRCAAGLGPGTPPELLSRSEVTPRSDLHLLGSTLYELLTGTAAFPTDVGRAGPGGRSAYRVPHPLTGPGIPEGLDPLLACATSVDPTLRPASAEVLGRLLQQVQRRGGLPLTPLVVVDPAADTSRLTGSPCCSAPAASSDADATFVPDRAAPGTDECRSPFARTERQRDDDRRPLRP